jgi:hypothetical protein
LGGTQQALRRLSTTMGGKMASRGLFASEKELDPVKAP